MFYKRSDHIDKLIERIWQLGYAATSRKYAAYLPTPPMIGEYEVDFIARSKNEFAIGLFVDDTELAVSVLPMKIEYLATRKHRNTNRDVTLFLGTSIANYFKLKKIVSGLAPVAQSNIRLYPTNAPEPTDLFSLPGSKNRTDISFSTN